MQERLFVQVNLEVDMRQGKKAKPEVRALAEALYGAGCNTREVRDYVFKFAKETVNEATLRRWRLDMRRRPGSAELPLYAQLAQRVSRADLVSIYGTLMDLLSQTQRQLSHLNTEQLVQITVLKGFARQCQWRAFDELAESLAYQWETLGRLREQMPDVDDRVRSVLCYLWSIEREGGGAILAEAWRRREQVSPPLGILRLGELLPPASRERHPSGRSQASPTRKSSERREASHERAHSQEGQE